jgi:hypothetical protein
MELAMTVASSRQKSDSSPSGESWSSGGDEAEEESSGRERNDERMKNVTTADGDDDSDIEEEDGNGGGKPKAVSWTGRIVIKRFNFASKTFRILEDGKEKTCRAGLLVEHCASDALRYLYDQHFWDPSVRNWIDKSTSVRKVVGGWIGIEEYGQRMKWPEKHLERVSSPNCSKTSSSGCGEDEVARLLGSGLTVKRRPIVVALLPSPGRETFPSHMKDSLVEDEETASGPISPTSKDHFIFSPPLSGRTVTVTDKCDVRPLDMKESLVEDEETAAGPISPTPTKHHFSFSPLLSGRTVTVTDKRDVRPPEVVEFTKGQEDIPATPTGGDDKSMNSCEVKKICLGTHLWEEGNNPTYARTIGIFTERKCFVCRVRFVDGVVYKVEENTWKIGGGGKRAHHCMTCNVCACNNCRLNLDLKSPPRRAPRVPSRLRGSPPNANTREIGK